MMMPYYDALINLMLKGFYRNFMMVLLEEILKGTPYHIRFLEQDITSPQCSTISTDMHGDVKYVRSHLEEIKIPHFPYNFFQWTSLFNCGVWT
jgi:hypothetical protein